MGHFTRDAQRYLKLTQKLDFGDRIDLFLSENNIVHNCILAAGLLSFVRMHLFVCYGRTRETQITDLTKKKEEKKIGNPDP